MAESLNESPRVLIEAKCAKELPDERHDDRIIQRAVFNGVSLSHSDLQEHRRNLKLRHVRAHRSEAIQAFYDAVGGVDVVALTTGATANALYIAKSRDRLPQKYKYELKMMASKAGHDLDDALFKAP